MKISEIYTNFTYRDTNLLAEANVFNTEEIKKEIEDIAKPVPDPFKKQFVRAATNEILNNEAYHTKITDLPDTAPAWAKKGFETGDLVIATVSDNAKNQFALVLDWLIDVINRSHSTETDQQSVAFKRAAQKILQSLPRMNISTMLEHMTQWNASTAPQNKGETTGMEMAADVGDGYKWWLLTSEEAFKREGSVLRNCIGKIHTWANSKDNKNIYVLKDRAQESVVAMSTTNPSNKLIEVKGDNNSPPVAKYMPAVNRGLNALGIKIANHEELNRSGYLVEQHGNEIKLVHVTDYHQYKPIQDLPNNAMIAKWTSPRNMITFGFYGFNTVPPWNIDPNGDRYDIVNKRNQYQPLLSVMINQNKIYAVGNLPSTARFIKRNSMEMLAEKLRVITSVLKKPINTMLNGTLRSPGLNRYGIVINQDGSISTDYDIVYEVGITDNPKLIESLPDANERLQLLAVRTSTSTVTNPVVKGEALLYIQNPTEAVQIEAMNVAPSVHILFGKFAAKLGHLPSEAVQLAAVTKDGTIIEDIREPSEAVLTAAVKQAPFAIAYAAYFYRKFKTPAPSNSVQRTAVSENPFALEYLFKYKTPVDDQTKLLAVTTLIKRDIPVDLYELELLKELFEKYNQMTPEVTELFNRYL